MPEGAHVITHSLHEYHEPQTPSTEQKEIQHKYDIHLVHADLLASPLKCKSTFKCLKYLILVIKQLCSQAENLISF